MFAPNGPEEGDGGRVRREAEQQANEGEGRSMLRNEPPRVACRLSGVTLTDGDRHDVARVIPLLETVPPVSGKRGRPQRLRDAVRNAPPLREDVVRPHGDMKGEERSRSSPLQEYTSPGDLPQERGREAESTTVAGTY